MSSLAVLGSRNPYRRLRSDGSGGRRGVWRTLRGRFGAGKLGIRSRRFRLFGIRILRLKRLLLRRRKGGPWGRVVKRLKESRSHLGDLFAGNYLFLPVSPTFPGTKNKIDAGGGPTLYLGRQLRGLPPNFSIV